MSLVSLINNRHKDRHTSYVPTWKDIAIYINISPVSVRVCPGPYYGRGLLSRPFLITDTDRAMAGKRKNQKTKFKIQNSKKRTTRQ